MTTLLLFVQKITQLQEKVRGDESELSKRAQRVASLEEQLLKLEKQMKAEYSKQESEVENAQNRVKVADERIATLDKVKDDLQTKLNEISDAIQTKSLDLEDLSREIEVKKEAADEAERIATEKKEALKAVEQSLADKLEKDKKWLLSDDAQPVEMKLAKTVKTVSDDPPKKIGAPVEAPSLEPGAHTSPDTNATPYGDDWSTFSFDATVTCLTRY